MYTCHVMYLDPSEVSNFLMGKIVEISHAPDTHTVLLHGRLCHGVKLSVDILGHFIVPTYLPRMILWNSEILPQIKGHKRQWTIWWTMINLTLKLIIYLGISLTPPQCRVHPTCWVGPAGLDGLTHHFDPFFMGWKWNHLKARLFFLFVILKVQV